MKRFEVGKVYYDHWACDTDSVSKIKIVARSAKMVTFERNGATRRARIREDANGEYIIPDRYSMACVYRAEREYIPEPVPAAVPQTITQYRLHTDVARLAVVGTLAGSLNARQIDFLMQIISGASDLVE